MKPRTNPEASIQAAVRDALNLVGFVRKVHTAGIPNKDRIRKNPSAGTSDLVGVFRAPCPGCGLQVGRFAAVEVKTPRGRLSDDQRLYLERMREAGGLAVVARSPVEALERLAAQVAEDRENMPAVGFRRRVDRSLTELERLAVELVASPAERSLFTAELARLRRFLELKRLDKPGGGV